jgi:hypothetical protein
MVLVLPVANGVMPKPDGGQVTGAFFSPQDSQVFSQLTGQDILICPWLVEEQTLYPVGVLARLLRTWNQPVADAAGQEHSLVMAVVEGRGHARWHSLQTQGLFLFTSGVEQVDLKMMRSEYPAVSAAGWLPQGGFTEFRADTDIPVTLYGTDLETCREVSVTANLGGLVTQEQAHTVEHGMLRALKTYGLSTPRTLLDSLRRETEELKRSVDWGIKFNMPEIFGKTATGACGNPMSNMAQFYLTQDFLDNLSTGKSVDRSLYEARRSTMSQLTDELGLTMNTGVRVLQGLKKGMRHDDTPLKVEVCKNIIRRFPFEPWG